MDKLNNITIIVLAFAVTSLGIGLFATNNRIDKLTKTVDINSSNIETVKNVVIKHDSAIAINHYKIEYLINLNSELEVSIEDINVSIGRSKITNGYKNLRSFNSWKMRDYVSKQMNSDE
jgi:hypothetical protein